jgi:hypothetical protein
VLERIIGKIGLPRAVAFLNYMRFALTVVNLREEDS